MNDNPPKELLFWFERRRIPIIGDMDMGSGVYLVRALSYLDQINHDPITLMIDSSGGNSADLTHVQDAINFIKSPVDGQVMGIAASAAFRLLQFCRYRLAWPNSNLVFHAASTRIKSDDADYKILETIRKLQKDNLRHLRILAKRSNHRQCSFADLVKWHKQERMFTARESLKYGFIDKIVKKQS